MGKIKIVGIAVLAITIVAVGTWIFEELKVRLQYPITVVDDLGREVFIPELPVRIVSIAPSCTEILFALELGSKVVGVSDHCNYPLEVEEKERVGGFASISVEKVAALDPDLVLATGGVQEKFVGKLEELGFPVIVLYPKNINGILRNIILVGEITGAEDEAEALVRDIRQRISQVENKVKDFGRPKVFYVVWHEPLWTTGRGTFQDDLITHAGGINIAAGAGYGWIAYSVEMLILQDPDVIILSHGISPKDVMHLPGWKDLSAVQENRIYVMPPDIADRAGPRIILALEEMAKMLHPDLFS